MTNSVNCEEKHTAIQKKLFLPQKQFPNYHAVVVIYYEYF